MMQGGRAEGGGRSIWGQGGLEQQGSARGSRRRGGNKSHATQQQPVASPQWPVSMSLAGFHGDSSAQRNGPSPSEYYGSMAAGSIVGAASRVRLAGGHSAPLRPTTEPQAKTHGRSQNGRRARPATGEGKGPTSCRAQTIRRHEGWMHLRPAELLPSAVQEAGLEQRCCVLEVAAL